MCHHKSVTRLRMSYDDGYLFSLTDPRSSAPHLVGRAAAH